MRKAWLAGLLSLLFARAGVAQTVRGTVVADGGRPVSGVVVALVDAGAKEIARALTNEQGEYRLTAPRPGSYRLRTLRIGFQSLLTEPMSLVAGDDVVRPLTVSTVIFSLDTVRATGRNPCKVVAEDSTSVVAALWDQVRSALIATQLTLATRTIQTTSISYNRMLDARSKRIGSQTLDVRSDFVTQPFRSLSAEALRTGGYVYTGPDSSRIYHSPDLTVLLSDEFIEDHCLKIAKESDDRRLGIDFEPTRARRNTPEIRGTLWLDRKTNELQEMVHRYINRIRLDEERIAGGEMGFTRMRNGMWAISRWNIHMPVQSAVPVYSPTLAVTRYDVRLDSIKQTGGELVMAVTAGSRRDTIWMRPPTTLRGTVLDSLSGAPVSGAIVSLAGTIQTDTTDAAGRFGIGGVLPGRYSLNVTTPSLDSLNTVDQHSIVFADTSMSLTIRVPNARMIAGSVCGKDNTATRLGAGIVLGSVMRRDTIPVANASISAQWNEITLSGGVAGNRVREVQTRTDARGVFRICGLPTATTYTVYAKSDSGEAKPVSVRLSGDQLFGRADLVMDRPPATASSFTGIVVDSAGKPLASADVLITDIARSGSTDATGSFRVTDVAPGTHPVIVRKIGYGQLEARIEFTAGLPTDRRIVLQQITVLDSVVSKAVGRDPLMAEFEEHRALGFGHFVTRDEILKREGALTSSFLGAFPGIRIATKGVGDWPYGTGKRCDGRPDVMPTASAPGSRCAIFYIPTPDEARRGVPEACFSKVYLDNQLMNPGTPTPPFNLRDVPTTQVEAIEYYARPAEIPVKYNNLNSQCGLVIIHTRRPP